MNPNRRRLRALSTLLFVYPLLILGCVSDEERIESHLEKGDAFLERGEGRQAILEFGSALQLSPNDPEINFKLAEAFRKESKYENAIYYYHETVRLDPSHHEAALRNAELLQNSEPDQAKALVDKVLQDSEENVDAHRILASIHITQGDLVEADNSLNRAMQIDPDDPKVHYQLARAARARIQELKLSGGEVPDDLYHIAIGEFDRAMELGLESREAMFEVALLHVSWAGHEKEAARRFKAALKAIERKPGLPFLERASLIISTFGKEIDDVELQRLALESLIQWYPESTNAWRQLAVFDQTHSGDGKQVFERMLRAQPDNLAAHALYANFLMSVRGVEAATAHLEVQIDKGLKRAPLLMEVIKLFVSADRLDAAIPYVEQLERDHPKSPQAKFARSYVLVAEGKYLEVIELLSPVVDELIDPNAYSLLSRAQLANGNAHHALESINNALAIPRAGNIEFLSQRTEIQEATGDWTGLFESLQALHRIRTQLTAEEQLRLAHYYYETGEIINANAIVYRITAGTRIDTDDVSKLIDNYKSNEPSPYENFIQALHQREVFDLRIQVHEDIESGAMDTGIQRIRDAIEGSQRWEYYLMLSQALFRAEDPEAEDMIRITYERQPNSLVVVELMQKIFVANDRQAELIEIFKEDTKDGGEVPAVYYELGERLAMAGRYEESIAVLEGCLELNPNALNVKNNLAYSLATTGQDLPRAAKLAKEARRGLGDKAAVLDTIGFVSLKEGNYEAAVEELQYAVELGVQEKVLAPNTYYHLGLALLETHESKRARSAFETALEINPDFKNAASAREKIKEIK